MKIHMTYKASGYSDAPCMATAADCKGCPYQNGRNFISVCVVAKTWPEAKQSAIAKWLQEYYADVPADEIVEL